MNESSEMFQKWIVLCTVSSYVTHSTRCECVCFAVQTNLTTVQSVQFGEPENKFAWDLTKRSLPFADSIIMDTKRDIRWLKFAQCVSCGYSDRSKQDSIDILDSNDSRKKIQKHRNLCFKFDLNHLNDWHSLSCIEV